jgi:hypothetical protein
MDRMDDVHICRLGVEAAKVEVRFERLTVEADVRVGHRAVPTLLNCAVNAAQVYIDRRSLLAQIITCMHAAAFPICLLLLRLGFRSVALSFFLLPRPRWVHALRQAATASHFPFLFSSFSKTFPLCL